LEILGEAFFESMKADTPPVTVYKLWKVLHNQGLLDGDSRLPAPSYRLTTKFLRYGVPEVLDAHAQSPMVSSKALFQGFEEDTERGSMSNERHLDEVAYQRVIDRPKSKHKKSGIFNPYSLTGRETGSSEGKEVAEDSGLWGALPSLENVLKYTEPTEDGKETQKKLRDKMITTAASKLAPFNDQPEDFVQWRDDAITTFTVAGRGNVLRPGFREQAAKAGWTMAEIKETDEWASVIIKAALAGCDDALDAFDQAPAGQGSLGFCYLRRHFELLGSNVAEGLRLDIEKFKPKVRESPVQMIRRLNKLYIKYSKCPNPETPTKESKLRKLYENAEKFEALRIKVKMIKSDMTSGKRPATESTHAFICEELISEWLSFGEADSAAIHVQKSETSHHDQDGNNSVEELLKELHTLRAELKVKVAHAAASSTLGQGKEGGDSGRWGARRDQQGMKRDQQDTKCLVPGCSEVIEAPKRSVNAPTMCRACWTAFHDGDDEERKLKDKRVVVKTHNPKYPKSVAIRQLMMKFQSVPDGCLDDQALDFCTMVNLRDGLTHASKGENKEVKIAVCSTKSKPIKKKVFILLDSAAGIGAGDVPEYYHGEAIKCRMRISGFDAKAESVSLGQYQPGAAVLIDDNGEEFIARYGGGLRAEEGQLDELIWSESQMLHAHDLSGGAEGAYITARHAQLVVPGGRAVNSVARHGHSVARHGLFGIEAELLLPDDSRWKTLDQAWVSADGTYTPPASLDPRRPIISGKKFKVYTVAVDHGHQEKVKQAVKKDLKIDSDLALKPFTHLARLDLDSATQKQTLQARLPFNNKTIALIFDMNTSGSEVLSPKGRKVLAEMEGVPFQKSAARFKMHKRRTRHPKKGKLDKYERNAGDVLDTDDYPTPHLKNCPSTQVISDPEVKVGWPYRNKFKSDLVHHAMDHFSNFVMPFVLRGDFAKQNHFGDNQIMCRGQAVQLKSTTPYHQWQCGGERYMFQLLNMSTHLMLDSQLPESLTVEVAEHAALLLMISPVEYKGLMTTGYKVYFQTDYNLTMLKRLGCLVYYRLEKKERKRFGHHGALAVHIGLNGFKFPDFTYKLYVPSSQQIIFRRDVLFAEDYMPFREGRGVLSALKEDHWIRPGVGVLSRSILREPRVTKD
jgi:hypothetical protein